MVLSGFFQKLGFGGGYAQGTGKSPHGPVPPPEEEPQKFRGYAQGTGHSLHGPVPPDLDEQSRMFEPLPVEAGDVEPPKSIARLRQFARLQQSVVRRRFHAAVWLLRRKISRLHRIYPAPRIAAFYLVGITALCLVLALFLFVPGKLLETPRHVDVRPETPNQAVARLYRLVSGKNYEEALRVADELEQKYPDDVRVILAKGTVAAARQDNATAYAEFSRAEKIDPGAYPVVFNLAELEFATGRYADAEVRYRRIRAAMPNDPLMIFRLYLCTRMQGKVADSVAYLQNPLIKDQSLEWYYMHASEALFEGRKQSGDELLEKARILFGTKALPYDATLVRLRLIAPRS